MVGRLGLDEVWLEGRVEVEREEEEELKSKLGLVGMPRRRRVRGDFEGRGMRNDGSLVLEIAVDSSAARRKIRKKRGRGRSALSSKEGDEADLLLPFPPSSQSRVCLY